MIAIVPVAGAGTNLRPHTFTQPKTLIPVAGKPIVAYILDRLVQAGVDEFVFVIGHMGEKVRMYVESNYPDIKASYVQQEIRKGLGHAIWKTKPHVADADEVVIMLGDTIVDADFEAILSNDHSCLGTKRVSDPRKFGVVEIGDDGVVKRVMEKPNIPKSNQAMVGLYKIKEVDVLMDKLEQNINAERRTHGEFQLTDALMDMIEDGTQFVQCEVDNWFDCGRKEILLETNAMLLDRRQRDKPETMQIPEIENSVVIQPVSIGENCKICNSIIGPHVSIGSNASIDSAIIQDSIIGSYASIQQIVLHHSVVGQDTAVRGIRRELNIGDNTEIDLG